MELLSSPLPAIAGNPRHVRRRSPPSSGNCSIAVSFFPRKDRISRQKSFQPPSAKKKEEFDGDKTRKNLSKLAKKVPDVLGAAIERAEAAAEKAFEGSPASDVVDALLGNAGKLENPAEFERDGPEFVFRFGYEGNQEKRPGLSVGDDSRNSQVDELLAKAKAAVLEASQIVEELEKRSVASVPGASEIVDQLANAAAAVAEASKLVEKTVANTPEKTKSGVSGIADEWGEKGESEAEQVVAGDPPKNDDEWGKEQQNLASGVSGIADEWEEKGESEAEQVVAADPPKDEDEWGKEQQNLASGVSGIADEWGEKGESEAEQVVVADPPKDEDEWGKEQQNLASGVSEIADEWGEKGKSEAEQVVAGDPPKDDDEWGKEQKTLASEVLGIADEWGEKGGSEVEQVVVADPPKDEDEWGKEQQKSASGVSGIADEWGEKGESEAEQIVASDPPKDDDEWGKEQQNLASGVSGIADEWGVKGETETESLTEPDPPKEDDEWGRDLGNGAYRASFPENDVEDLKQCLVDSFYGVEYGLAASSELRAEILELINQLEAVNPTPAPMEAPELLDGNWVLLYTAYSELLPLIVIGRAPLLKVKRISQEIDTRSLTIKNSTTISSPFASFSFSASASFEVQTPSRVQVRFREGSFDPPEVLQSVDLPESTEVFGQRVNLLPLQQALGPLQAAAASISAAISGQPSLKVRIPGERSESWLVTTFLDKDLRISRGDGGLFVLAREGSSLLNL
ncbi:uncharacterized protein LOC144708963 [Wolffia australiana]